MGGGHYFSLEIAATASSLESPDPLEKMSSAGPQKIRGKKELSKSRKSSIQSIKSSIQFNSTPEFISNKPCSKSNRIAAQCGQKHEKITYVFFQNHTEDDVARKLSFSSIPLQKLDSFCIFFKRQAGKTQSALTCQPRST